MFKVKSAGVCWVCTVWRLLECFGIILEMLWERCKNVPTCWLSRSERGLHLFRFLLLVFLHFDWSSSMLVENSLHGGSCCAVSCNMSWCVGMFVMFCFALNVAGQHFSVISQLFYIRGIWGNVHCKLKLSIKVQLCVCVGVLFQMCFLLMLLHKMKCSFVFKHLQTFKIIYFIGQQIKNWCNWFLFVKSKWNQQSAYR